MLAFAANSLLARLALTETQIDPATFSVVRLMSGAICLVLVVLVRNGQLPFASGRWLSAFALFVYAVAFSFAYTQINTGLGALLLFGSVQASMLGYGFTQGERFNTAQWVGFLVAAVGVTFLLVPGALLDESVTPAPVAALLMILSGVAWAVYTLSAGSAEPVLSSAGNFARTLPFCAVLIGLYATQIEFDGVGVFYACVSGALTSGLGYVAWYSVLPAFSVTNAATLQLSVPALAALMGVFILGEPVSAGLIIAAGAILIGIGVVLRSK